MSGTILLLLKHWKITVVLLLVLGWAVNGYLAHHRGKDLEEARAAMQVQHENFKTQLELLEKARQDDKERSQFRKLQARTFKTVDNESLDLGPELQSAYDRLRERQDDRRSR